MKFYHYIIAVLLLGLSACSSDEPAPNPLPSGDSCNLVLTLQLGASNTTGPATKADQPWGDPYPDDPGIPSESVIKNLYLYFVTPDNTVIPLTPVLLRQTEGKYVYKFSVNLKSDFVTLSADGKYSLTGRIVAMVNFPEGAPANPFSFSPYNVSLLDEEGAIPMWGVASIDNIILEPDKTIENVADIRLLRSVSKVTFEIDDAFKDKYTITSVSSPFDFELTAFCQPRGGLTAISSANLMIEGCFNPSQGLKGAVNKFYFSSDRKKVWCYIAETALKSVASGGIPPYFNLVLRSDEKEYISFPGKIYMCDYNNGSPQFSTAFDLVRNHDYKYFISLTPLEFVVSFKEWIPGGNVHLELE